MGIINRIKDAIWSNEKNAVINMASFGGAFDGNNQAGVPVNEESAKTLVSVFAAVRLVAMTTAALKINVCEWNAKGISNIRDIDPIWQLLNVKANHVTTAIKFRSTLVGHCVLTGNGFSAIERNPFGDPLALWNLSPREITIRQFTDGSLQYHYRNPLTNRTIIIPSKDMIHITSWGSNGVLGISPIEVGAGVIGLGIAGQQYQAAFFKHSAVPPYILKAKGMSTPDKENFQKEWNDRFQGSANAHKLPIASGESLEFIKIGVNPKDAQILELMQANIQDIARLFGVPNGLLGDDSRSTFNNIEEKGREFIIYSLRSWFKTVEQEIACKLFSDPMIHLVHDTSKLTETKYGESIASNVAGYQGGLLSKNEGREGIGRNPTSNGDDFLVPMNMNETQAMLPIQEIQAMLPMDATTDNEPTIDPLVAAVAEATIERLSRVESDKGKRASKKEGYAEWLSNFTDAHASVVCKEFAPFLQDNAETYTETYISRMQERMSDMEQYSVDVNYEVKELMEVISNG